MKFPKNAYTGNDLKQAGQKLALDNSGEWKDEVMHELRKFLRNLEAGELFGFDEFRTWTLFAGVLPDSASINSWGGVPRMACKAGLIAETDQYKKSSIPSAHHRVIRMWRAL